MRGDLGAFLRRGRARSGASHRNSAPSARRSASRRLHAAIRRAGGSPARRGRGNIVSQPPGARFSGSSAISLYRKVGAAARQARDEDRAIDAACASIPGAAPHAPAAPPGCGRGAVSVQPCRDAADQGQVGMAVVVVEEDTRAAPRRRRARGRPLRPAPHQRLGLEQRSGRPSSRPPAGPRRLTGPRSLCVGFDDLVS